MSEPIVKNRPTFPLAVEPGNIANPRVPGPAELVQLFIDVAGASLCEAPLVTRHGTEIDIGQMEMRNKRSECCAQMLHRLGCNDVDKDEPGVSDSVANPSPQAPISRDEPAPDILGIDCAGERLLNRLVIINRFKVGEEGR